MSPNMKRKFKTSTWVVTSEMNVPGPRVASKGHQVPRNLASSPGREATKIFIGAAADIPADVIVKARVL